MVFWNLGYFSQDLILPDSWDGASPGWTPGPPGRCSVERGPGWGGQLEGCEGGRQSTIPSAAAWIRLLGLYFPTLRGLGSSLNFCWWSEPAWAEAP